MAAAALEGQPAADEQQQEAAAADNGRLLRHPAGAAAPAGPAAAEEEEGAGAGGPCACVADGGSSSGSGYRLKPNGLPAAAASSAAAGLRQRRPTQRHQQQEEEEGIDPAAPPPPPAGQTSCGTAGTSPAGRPQSCASSLLQAAAAPRSSRRPSLVRRYAALQATFCFSAAWHIAIFWYNTHVVCWRWVAFFSLQAPIVTLERLVVAHCRAAGLLLPRWAAVLLTNLLLIAVANPLFFGPADEYGFAPRCLSNFDARYKWFEGWLHGVLHP
jgi:hypothetical protein